MEIKPIRPFWKILTKTNSTYILEYDELNELMTTLYSDTFFNDLGLLFNEPQESVVRINMVPLWLHDYIVDTGYVDVTNQMKIGKYVKTFETSISKLKEDFQRQVLSSTETLFSQRFGEIENSFKSFEPYTKTMLYIPYFGFQEIDLNLLYNKYIKFNVVIDFLTGEMMFAIFVRDTLNDVPYMVYEFTTKCFIEMPLGASNANELAKSVTLGAIGLGVGMISGGLMAGTAISYAATQEASIKDAMYAETGQATTALNAVNNTVGFFGSITNKSSSHNQVAGWLSTFNPKDIYLVMVKDKFDEPDDYAHHYGRPSKKYVQISQIASNTFFKISSINFKNNDIQHTMPLEEEKNEIITLLMGGVIM